jgi:hypothetical protein
MPVLAIVNQPPGVHPCCPFGGLGGQVKCLLSVIDCPCGSKPVLIAYLAIPVRTAELFKIVYLQPNPMTRAVKSVGAWAQGIVANRDHCGDDT